MLTLLFTVGLFAQRSQLAQEWRVCLAWLPGDVETLIVATQPFAIPPLRDLDVMDDVALIDSLRGFALGPLNSFPNVYRALNGTRARFAVTGIQAFFDPSGLGVGQVRSVSIIRFDQPLAAAWSSFLDAQQLAIAASVPIYSFSAIREGSLRDRPEPLTVFVAQTAPDTLLLASTSELLQVTLSRRAGGSRRKSDLTKRAEWRAVNPNSPVFAWRHYQKPSGISDERPDPEANGVTYNATEGQHQALTYLSPSALSPSLLLGHWSSPKDGLTVKTRRTTPASVTVDIRLNESEARVLFYLRLLEALGYQIAI